MMLSQWNHAICASCYQRREPGREPMRLKPEWRQKEVCCFCGEFTEEGIYYRAEPHQALCKGKHD